MKSRLIFLFLAFSPSLFSQSFVEAPQAPPFENVSRSSIAFADVDGDMDQDVLITGTDSSGLAVSKLYINDGMGSFTEMMSNSFEGVQLGSVAFADVDGDDDPDVLITGSAATAVISKLYINDGMGNFTEMMGTPFEAVRSSFVAFADVDGDNDEDVLITGRSGAPGAPRTTKFYTNDGMGNFTEVSAAPFNVISSGSICFSDVDSDNDLDLILSGFTTGGTSRRIAKLYTNDGIGNFTEITGTPFEGVSFSSSACVDVDGDNDQDVLITGFTTDGSISKLYTNDGAGNFTEVTGTPFDSVNLGSIAFADVDGDNDQDVLITGSNDSTVKIANLYINDGRGNFTELMGTPFEGVFASSIAFADVDGDNDQDVLITGADSSGLPISTLYLNEGMANSIDEIDLSLAFEVFPNPSPQSTLFLRYEAEAMSEISIKVYTLNGVLLKEQQEFALSGEHIFSIDITSFAKGMYIMELDNGKRKGLSKFLLE